MTSVPTPSNEPIMPPKTNIVAIIVIVVILGPLILFAAASSIYMQWRYRRQPRQPLIPITRTDRRPGVPRPVNPFPIPPTA